MNRETLKLVRQKKRLWKSVKSTGTQESWQAYKIMEKKVKKKVKNAKHQFEKNIAKNAKKDPKSFYAYLNNKKSNREKIGPIQDTSGKLHYDDQRQANILNQFYTSVFTHEDPNIPASVVRSDCPDMPDIEITAEQICTIIKCLKKDSAGGPDGINPQVLIETAEEICVPLKFIFQKSLDTGMVPHDWRTANITPVFKKGSKSEPGNYRPISLTSSICKVMERVLKGGIINHLDKNNLIRPSQHGFMHQKSCTTNLIEFFEKVTKSIDESHAIDILYFDFAKAFDKVPHQRLLQKLKCLRLNENVVTWIANWLKNRKQHVVINGVESSWQDVISSIIQGSVLGPCLFIIFIDDIDMCAKDVECIISKFADDTKLGKSICNNNDAKELQTVVDRLWDWSVKWGMEFNVKKCKVMHLGKNNPGTSYFMNGIEIVSTSEQKDLGVIITDNMKPSLQCAAAVKKANQVLGQIRRGFSCFDKDTFVRIYKTYVRPHLEYAVQSWSPWTQQDINSLEAVQKRAIRQITGIKGTYEEKLKQLNLTTLLERRKRGDAIETFKILKGFTNVDPSIWFQQAI